MITFERPEERYAGRHEPSIFWNDGVRHAITDHGFALELHFENTTCCFRRASFPQETKISGGNEGTRT